MTRAVTETESMTGSFHKPGNKWNKNIELNKLISDWSLNNTIFSKNVRISGLNAVN